MADTRTPEHYLLTEESQDTEIVLGTGKLLGIFFGLVVLCAIFFSMGYVLGHSSSGGKTDVVGDTPAGAPIKGKPSAVDKNAAAGPIQPAAQTTHPVATSTPSESTSSPAATANVPTAPAADKPVSSGGIYMVQVAAVSKREDADILVSVLQKKQYPVFVANAPGDALFHVQVGPFTDPKDAEAMRSRLVSDGYNAIVKK
jgi:cell division septation protein DedD